MFVNVHISTYTHMCRPTQEGKTKEGSLGEGMVEEKGTQHKCYNLMASMTPSAPGFLISEQHLGRGASTIPPCRIEEKGRGEGLCLKRKP